LPDLLLPVGVFGRPCYCLHTSAHCASLLSLLTHARTRPRSLTRHTHLWDDSPFSESEYTPIHGECTKQASPAVPSNKCLRGSLSLRPSKVMFTIYLSIHTSPSHLSRISQQHPFPPRTFCPQAPYLAAHPSLPRNRPLMSFSIEECVRGGQYRLSVCVLCVRLVCAWTGVRHLHGDVKLLHVQLSLPSVKPRPLQDPSPFWPN